MSEPQTMEQTVTEKTVVTVQVPKELNDVRVAVVGILKDFKAKKPVTEIVAGNFGKLQEAFAGFDKVDDELKNSPAAVAMLAGLFGGELIGALLE